MSALTGAYLLNYIQQKAGLAYTSYYDNTKWNRAFEDAFIQIIEDRYNDKQSQKFKDDLYFLISSNNIISVLNNNSFYLRPIPITNVTFSTTTITITTLVPHNVVVGNSVNVSGITGFATNNPNGTFTVVSTPTIYTYTYTAGSAPTGGPYTDNSGEMYLINGQLVDYLHLFSVKANYLLPYPGITVNSGNYTTANPVIITMPNYTNLRSGEYVNVTTSTGPTSIGNFYLKQLNALNYQLYTDMALQVPFAPGGGVMVGNLTVSRNFYNYCKPYMPDEKNGVLNQPTTYSPRFEMADGMVKLYPLTANYVCLQATIDYLKRPFNVYGDTLFIDMNDTELDLTLYYPEKFMMDIVDKTISMLGLSNRDETLIVGAAADRKES